LLKFIFKYICPQLLTTANKQLNQSQLNFLFAQKYFLFSFKRDKEWAWAGLALDFGRGHHRSLAV
jgi:hypothetical protein